MGVSAKDVSIPARTSVFAKIFLCENLVSQKDNLKSSITKYSYQYQVLRQSSVVSPVESFVASVANLVTQFCGKSVGLAGGLAGGLVGGLLGEPRLGELSGGFGGVWPSAGMEGVLDSDGQMGGFDQDFGGFWVI